MARTRRGTRRVEAETETEEAPAAVALDALEVVPAVEVAPVVTDDVAAAVAAKDRAASRVTYLSTAFRR